MPSPAALRHLFMEEVLFTSIRAYHSNERYISNVSLYIYFCAIRLLCVWFYVSISLHFCMYSPNAFPGDLSELTMIQFPLLSLYKKYLFVYTYTAFNLLLTTHITRLENCNFLLGHTLGGERVPILNLKTFNCNHIPNSTVQTFSFYSLGACVSMTHPGLPSFWHNSSPHDKRTTRWLAHVISNAEKRNNS